MYRRMLADEVADWRLADVGRNPHGQNSPHYASHRSPSPMNRSQLGACAGFTCIEDSKPGPTKGSWARRVRRVLAKIDRRIYVPWFCWHRSPFSSRFTKLRRGCHWQRRVAYLDPDFGRAGRHPNRGLAQWQRRQLLRWMQGAAIMDPRSSFQPQSLALCQYPKVE